MGRQYFEALIMGLCIGLGALLLNSWVGEASWPVRLVLLAFVGGLLCLVQYWLTRLRR